MTRRASIERPHADGVRGRDKRRDRSAGGHPWQYTSPTATTVEPYDERQRAALGPPVSHEPGTRSSVNPQPSIEPPLGIAGGFNSGIVEDSGPDERIRHDLAVAVDGAITRDE
jgi:hypothetical protein